MANTGMKWNSDEIVKFLDIYEHDECLWNIRHSDYSNKLKRDSMMSKLMSDIIRENVFIKNIECLRKKIKIMKNVYRQELLKVEKSTKSGAGVDDIYQPKLIWYKRADNFSRFRFNVAVTRARSLLIVVGNPHLLEADTHWRDLINFTRELHSYRGCKYSPRSETEWMEPILERFQKLNED